MNIILLSGGSGTRLWPLSNNVRSKQFLKIMKRPDGSHESMVQRMYRMIKDTDPDSSVTIATSDNQVASIRSQLNDGVSISVEPSRRDTFPAMALATAYLHDELGIDRDSSVIVCPVDPYVEASYFEMLKNLEKRVEEGVDNLVLMGIEPTYPSAKYGYIIPSVTDAVSAVDSFKEKPDEATAGEYIKRGALWNAGVFAYKLSYVLDKSRELLGASDYKTLFNNYETLKKISFDYAVVEQEEKISVLRYKGTWKDLGTWNTLTEAMSDEVSGNAVAAECENTHIVNELQVPLVALGVKNLAIAATPDGILVSDKHMSSYLKDYVADARPMTEKRLWGEYEVLDYRKGEEAGNTSLTKHLYIKAGEHISYQTHHHRSETWVIVEGSGKVILDDVVRTVSRGDTVIVPVGSKHAVKADTDLHIIEVQVGDELTEEDVEHLPYDWTARDRYNHWLDAGFACAASLTDEEIADAFRCDLHFGTGGLRAVMGSGTNRLNIYTVAKASAGVSKYINEHYDNPSVVIAYDTRHNSKEFADVAARVFGDNGLKVYVFSEPVPTPMLSYAVWNLDCSAGIVITASHNSKEYNGYKVYDHNGCQITNNAAKEIQECIDSVDIYTLNDISIDKSGSEYSLVPKTIFGDYIDSTLAASFVKDGEEQDLRILYTPLNGTGLKPVMAALAKAGFGNVENILEQREPDGDFKTCPYPNPELEKVMEDCIPFGEQYNADIIIATDPDCDRIGVVCKGLEGGYKRLSPNEVGVLLFDWICHRYAKTSMPTNPVFMKTVVTTSMAERIAEKHGVSVVNTLTGFKYIGEQMEGLKGEQTFIFAMEESCGYLSNVQLRDKDGVNAALLVCRMAQDYKNKGMALDDVLEKLYSQYGWFVNDQVSYQFDGADGIGKINVIMDKLKDLRTELGDIKIDEMIDYSAGYKDLPPTNMREFKLSDGSRFLIRPSGTEPKLKIYIEAVGNSHRDAADKADAIKAFVTSIVR